MKLCGTLANVQRRFIHFDPSNIEHLKAFRSLCLGDPANKGELTGEMTMKQHPVLRFDLEEQYESIPQMMLHKVGKHYIAMMEGKVQQ